MSKKIKNYLLTSLALLLAVCTCFLALSFLQVGKAYADTAVQGVNAVYIRVPAASEADTYYGIKFRGYVTEAQFTANAQAGETLYGMEIIPEDLIEKGGTAYDSGKEGVSLQLTKDGSNYYFYASIVNVKQNNLTRPYAARTYYQIDGGQKVYGDWCAGRAVFSVASQALASKEANLSPVQSEKLSAIIDTATDTNKNGHYYAESLTVTENTGKSLDALATGDVITVTSTLTNGTNDIVVYPQITAVNVDGLGEKLDGVLTQVAGTQNQFTVNLDTEKAFKIEQTLGSVKTTSLGSMVEANTALITSAADFEAFASTANTTKANAVMVNDISNLTRVGASSNSQNYGFKLLGVFDGNNKKITNVATSGFYGGLFCSLGKDSTVKDLYLQGTVEGTRSGLLAGSWQDGYKVDIVNVTILAEVKSGTNLGAVVGWGNNVDELTVDGLTVFTTTSNGAAFANAVNVMGSINMTNSYFYSDVDLVVFTSANNAVYETNKNLINALKPAISDAGSSRYVLGGTDGLALDLGLFEGTVQKVYLNGAPVVYTLTQNELFFDSTMLNALEDDASYQIAIITDADAYEYTLNVGSDLVTQGVTSVSGNTYTLATKTPGANYANRIALVDNNYVAWKDDYGVNTYVEFEFTGNNMPNVMFYADTVDGKLYGYDFSGGNDSGATITNATARQGLWLSSGWGGSNGNHTDAKFRVWGMNRFNPTSLNGGYTSLSGYLYEHEYSATDATGMNYFTQEALKNDYATTTFKYVVGTYKDINDNIAIDAKLYNKATGELVASIDLPTTFKADSYKGGIIAYAPLKSDTAPATFTVVKAPYAYAPEQATFVTQGVTSVDGNTYTLGSKAPGASYINRIALVDNNYLAWKGNYGAGTYLEFEFTGNNMPQMMFYADTIDGKLYGYDFEGGNDSGATITNATARQGLLLLNGFGAGTGSSSTANHSDAKFRIWGMNRLNPTGLKCAYRDAGGYLYGYVYNADDDTGMNAFTGDGLKTDYATTTFKYVVGTYANAEGKICVDAKLYNKADNSLVASIDFATEFNASEYSGNVIAYTPLKADATPTTFTVVKAPYDINAVEEVAEENP